MLVGGNPFGVLVGECDVATGALVLVGGGTGVLTGAGVFTGGNGVLVGG